MSNRTVNRLILACLLVLATSVALAMPARAYTNGGWSWYPMGNLGWRDVGAWLKGEAIQWWEDNVSNPDVVNKSAWRSVGTRSEPKPVQPKAEVTEQN